MSLALEGGGSSFHKLHAVIGRAITPSPAHRGSAVCARPHAEQSVISTTALTAAVAVAQLAAADVRIDVSPLRAFVEARYEFVAVPDTLRLVAPRLDGLRIRVNEVTSSGRVLPFRSERGAILIPIVPTGPALSVELRYEIREAGAHRIPLFVPDAPAAASAGTVRIRLTGVAEHARLIDAFPRLTREPDGATVATLANVPSLVRLPPAEGSWSTNRVADLAVIVLVAGSSLLWLLRRRSRNA